MLLILSLAQAVGLATAGLATAGLATAGLATAGPIASELATSELQQRIEAAAVGSTIEVAPGNYFGPLLIDKPLTLVGRGFPSIDGRGAGSVVSVRAQDVTVRGFHIHNSGINLSKDDAGVHITADRAVISGNRIDDVLHGIYVKKSLGFRISQNDVRGKTTLPPTARPASEAIATDGAEYCAPLNVNSRGNGIHLWNSSGGEIDNNSITETRDGMYFSFTRDTQVRGNHINGVRYGLHYMYSDSNEFQGNTFTDNAAGAAIMYSKHMTIIGNHFDSNHGFRAYGMLLNSVDNTHIEGNWLNHNTVGIYLENNNNNRLVGNHIEGNYIGLRMTASSNDNVFSRNHLIGNMHSAEMVGQNDSNHWSVDGVGNYWSEANPVDITGDGIGDLPYREADLIGDLRRDAPMVGLLSDSPGMNLLKFVHRHVALPGFDAIEDPAPLTQHYERP